jgi:hypothetical protein
MTMTSTNHYRFNVGVRTLKSVDTGLSKDVTIPPSVCIVRVIPLRNAILGGA